MLNEILKNNRFCFHKEFSSWQDAIHASCEPLLREGAIDEQYESAIIQCIETYGPYIVIAPDIAMPHASEGAVGVFTTAISFMKVEKPVHFDVDDTSMDARLFFVLAAIDHEQHLSNMIELADQLSDSNLVQALLKVQNEDDLKKVAAVYEREEKTIN